MINTEHFKNKIKSVLDLSNYVTKSDLKNATDTNRQQDTSKIAKNAHLARLKSNVDNFDIDKLETTPVDLTKLCKKMMLLKRLCTMHSIQSINASCLVKKAEEKNLTVENI